jgi:inhibitor of KinA
VVPLGDQAVLVYLTDEAEAVRFAATVRAANPPWLQDVVPAYGSVGVFFDADQIDTANVIEWLQSLPVDVVRRLAFGKLPPTVSQSLDTSPTRGEDKTKSQDQNQASHVLPSPLVGEGGESSSRVGGKPSPAEHLNSAAHHSSLITHHYCIPVCYEMAPDMPRVCEHTGLTSDDVIRLHTSIDFTVYAIGFVPGFPYMGYLPPELCGVGRLPSPRVRVEPGSVGLTGRQTGIYPLPRPGGWNLIGRTPLVIVDVASGFFPLRVGDVVRFIRIDDAEFRRLEGERLA